MHKKILLSCFFSISLAIVMTISLSYFNQVKAADGEWESGDERSFRITQACHDGILLDSVYEVEPPPPTVITNGRGIDIGVRLYTSLDTTWPITPSDATTRKPEASYGPSLAPVTNLTMTYHTTKYGADVDNSGIVEANEFFSVYFTDTKLLWTRYVSTGAPIAIIHKGVGWISANVQDCWLNRLNVTQGTAATLGSNRLDARYGFFPAADLAYRVDALPTNGTLLLNGTPLVVGSYFTQDDINQNRLVYQHNGTPTTSDTFSYTVRGTTRASVSSNGTQGQNGGSANPSLSRNGSRVAFDSSANNLVAGDTNTCAGFATSGTCPDIFIHDLGDGTTIRASVSASNTQANGSSTKPSLDGLGYAVAFQSLANNLVTGTDCETLSDTNGVSDVYRKFIGGGLVNRVSISAERFGACDQGNGGSFAPAISADSIFVAFESDANNLINKISISDTNGLRDIFSYANGSERVRKSIVDGFSEYSNSASAQATGGTSAAPAIADLESGPTSIIIAFDSAATNLIGAGGDTNGFRDVFVRDSYHASFDTVRVSSSYTGSHANGASQAPSISYDGRFIAFESQATNLVTGDTNGFRDIFVRDRDRDKDEIFDETNAVTTTRVSTGIGGVQPNNNSFKAKISAYGRYVAFYSQASNLVSSDTNTCGIFSAPGECLDIFIHDRQTGQNLRASVSMTGTEANGYSQNPSISADGQYVAFESFANNLVPNDTNNQSDVFVHYAGFSSSFHITIALLPPRAYLPLVIR